MKLQERFQEAKFLSVIGVAVLLSGFFSFRGFLQAPPDSSGSAPLGRAPASFEKAPGGSSVVGTRLETFMWNCRDTESPSIEASHLRLKSNFCDKTAPKELHVLNLSNGYTASIFLSEQGFSTDFMDLREGENRIEIRWVSEHGQDFRQEIRLVRRLPASESVEDGGAH